MNNKLILLIPFIILIAAAILSSVSVSATTDNVTWVATDNFTISENNETLNDTIETSLSDLSDTITGLSQAVKLVALFLPLIFFTWLTIKIESDWGSPILAILTGGLSFIFGMNAPDIIDGKYVTSSFGLALAVAMIIYSLVCVGWSWDMMFKGRPQNAG
jgi:hypothetical protein